MSTIEKTTIRERLSKLLEPGDEVRIYRGDPTVEGGSKRQILEVTYVASGKPHHPGRGRCYFDRLTRRKLTDTIELARRIAKGEAT